tara:strand:+ start:857 stop:2842 length:1986 start_codon:yes stop_codon:yes gene_type:complete
MPDPTEQQIQQRLALEFRQIREGESDQEWDARMAQGNPLADKFTSAQKIEDANEVLSSSDSSSDEMVRLIELERAKARGGLYRAVNPSGNIIPTTGNTVGGEINPAVNPSGGIIPPPGNTVGENIDQTVNPGGMSAQDLATIQQAKSLYDPARQIPVTPTPSNAALMPTLNQPINVGTSSGQITGSHGVYVNPGFVAPWGALMQKQAAQDTQTNLALKNQQLAKKARDTAFKFEKPKFKVKDPGFQKSLNETATSTINSYTDQAKELGGKDWQVMLKTDTRLGREFQSAMDGLNLLVRNADRATDKFAEIDAGTKSGDVYYSDEIRKIRRDYENLTDEAFGGGDIEKLAGIRQLYKDLDGHMELNTFLNDKKILSNIKGQISGSTGISDMGEFKQLKTTNRTLYDENIKNIIQSVKTSMGSEYPYTDEDIETTLLGHFQNKSTSTKSLKPKPKGGGGGLKIDPANTVFQEGNKPVVVSSVDSDNNRTESTYNSVSTLPMPQKKGGVKFEGAKSVGVDGKLTEIADIASLNPVSSQIMEYTEDGETKYKKVVATEVTKERVVMVPEKGILGETLYNEDNTVKMTPHKDGKTETVIETIMLDAETSKDQLKDKFGDDYYNQYEKNYSKFSNPSPLQEAVSEFGQAKYNQLSPELKKEFDNTYK